MPETAFSSLPLSPAQLRTLDELGYRRMTPIQAASLPLAMAGTDLIAQAATGSGKTAAFALPLLSQLNPRDFGTQALVLCPTRELASQVAGEIRRLARHRQNIKVAILCGGQPLGPQIASLAHGAHVVVGTPGRVRDHLRKQTLDLGRVGCLVLDEADRMLDMGFLEDMEAIIAAAPDRRQTLLFSATFPGDIQRVSDRFQRAPRRVAVDSLPAHTQIDQRFFSCEAARRLPALRCLLGHYQPEAAVVFCNTRQTVGEICAFLQEQGISAAALHGELEQRDRERVLAQFRQSSIRILVATDVAARGLDIDGLPAVVNYQLPYSADVYVHRVGRTGRAGESGLALSLFSDAERHRLEAIGDYLQRSPEVAAIDTLDGSGASLPPPAFVTLEIAAGRKDKIRPGDILGALTKEAGIDSGQVGRIEVLERVAYVAIAREVADLALGRLLNGRIKGRRLKLRRL